MSRFHHFCELCLGSVPETRDLWFSMRAGAGELYVSCSAAHPSIVWKYPVSRVFLGGAAALEALEDLVTKFSAEPRKLRDAVVRLQGQSLCAPEQRRAAVLKSFGDAHEFEPYHNAIGVVV